MAVKAPTVCTWAEAHPLLRAYHDEEWGVPEWDSRALWEELVLDGFQAGLSWLTVLQNRDAIRAAFKDFAPEAVARFGMADVNRLLKNEGNGLNTTDLPLRYSAWCRDGTPSLTREDRRCDNPDPTPRARGSLRVQVGTPRRPILLTSQRGGQGGSSHATCPGRELLRIR